MRSAVLLIALAACNGDPGPEDPYVWPDHGPVAEGVFAPLGEPVPYATPEQLETFARGRIVAEHRWSLEEGLGPAFNVTFCAACHEKPVIGGSAGLYRNFLLGGRVTSDGAFFMGESAGNPSGVIRMYAYSDDYPARPEVPETTTVIAQRNPIPFFGVGLLAELSNEEILKRADPDDLDGDGISGRPNWDRGFVGRFGVKSQTVSIEGFLRGPLMNHLGITSDPLTEEQRAALPVDSSGGGDAQRRSLLGLGDWLQAAAPDGPLTDEDAAPDPELDPQELFDLVSFSMLLAPAPLEELTAQGIRGRKAFDVAGCGDCHTPRLIGPRGPLPVYSDLLLHDMGPELDDHIQMKEAPGYEFRTQPLWGISATGPYLHDGRATTIEEAIHWHGGEGQRSRDVFASFSREDQDALIEFLLSLGGRSQAAPGLIPPGTPIAAVGTWGGPARALSADEEALFLRGRGLFDHEFGLIEGVGGPRFNGDSCRACHFEPVVGGAGPRGVNVSRHGIAGPDGRFVPPSVGTVLHKQTALADNALRAQPDASIFEHRQTPHLFGLGAIESIPDEVILALADPEDLDGDGISGKPSRVDGDRLGRFGWKAQVPSIDEFVRDAVTTELGMTLPYVDGLLYGRIFDNDDVPDPEYTLEDAAALGFYMKLLAPPPRATDPSPEALAGEVVFASVGCDRCHAPSLPGADGPVPLYSDLLLHEILPPEQRGIEEFSADEREFRTPPLWGVSRTGPWLHSGAADTLDQAVRAHDGEARAIRDAYEALDPADRSAHARLPGDPLMRPLALLLLVACNGDDPPTDGTTPTGTETGTPPTDGIVTDPLSMPAEPLWDPAVFPPAADCASCHADHYAEWRTSMHAYAMVDPVFQALSRVRQDDLAATEDMFCQQCHSAIGTRGGEIVPFFSYDDLSPIVLEGITCTSCHKVVEVARDHNSGHVIDPAAPMQGPIADPIESPAHASAYNPTFEGSLFCGGCHDVIENSGLDLERPYREWTESPAAREGVECQSCHMPEIVRPAVRGGPERTTHEHRWVGVDVPLLDGWMTPDEEADLRGRISALLATAATVHLAGPPEVRVGETFDVTVTVRNEIPAHNLPTGSTFLRQMWLELVAVDGDGRELYSTGLLDANGDLKDHWSALEPYADADLVSFSSGFVDGDGARTLFPWRAAEHTANAITPEHDRTVTLFVPTASATAGPVSIRARVRFRALPPYLLRTLGMTEAQVAKLDIHDLAEATLSVPLVAPEPAP